MISVKKNLHCQVTYSGGKRTTTQLTIAHSGELRIPVSKQEAVAVAKSLLKPDAAVNEVKYITATDGHHEYTEKAVPSIWHECFSANGTWTPPHKARRHTCSSSRTDERGWRAFKVQRAIK